MADMPSKVPWYKDHTMAVWITGIPAEVFIILSYFWPPDPAHPPGTEIVRYFKQQPFWLVQIELIVLICLQLWFARRARRSNEDSEQSGPSEPLSFNQLFEIHSHELDPRISDPSNKAVYTAKTRLVLENKTGKAIQISHAKWLTGENNVSVQCGASPYPGIEYKSAGAEFCCWYQREDSKGSWKKGAWKKKTSGADDEGPSIFIEPGWSFRIWVGLNPCVPDDVMKQRKRTRQLGTLILPIQTDNRQVDVSVEI